MQEWEEEEVEEEGREGDSLNIRPTGSHFGSLLILAEPSKISISSSFNSSISNSLFAQLFKSTSARLTGSLLILFEPLG